MKDILATLRPELIRALSNFHYERTEDGGLYLPESNTRIGGVFRHSVNGGDVAIDPNVMVFSGLDDILKVYFGAGAQRTGFFVALFSGNASPSQSLTAATFVSTQTEFTAYNESTRQSWTPDAEASQGITNGAAPAVFTMATGGPYTVWGAALTTSSAKSSTSGLLVCCSQFGVARTLLATDVLSLQYTITAADAG